jgi:hypothetical protein
MPLLNHPMPSELMGAFVDITAPVKGVGISWDSKSRRVWVNVDGICVFRACQIPYLEINGDVQAQVLPSEVKTDDAK